jgi:hypothetical protein
MAYAKIEPSGCTVWHGGLVRTRFDLFLKPGDARYDERYTYVPVIPIGGYPGPVDKDGIPKKQSDYDAWIASLPHIWQLAPFHSHFLPFEPDVSPDAVLAAIEPHIPNFYAAWLQELDKEKGGMRHGWDIATRIPRPRRYDKEMTPQELAPRQLECLTKVNLIKASNLSIHSTGIGEIFPATTIDIGDGAINRSQTEVGDTLISNDNPANDTGSLDTVEVWPNANMTTCVVGTCFLVSGTTFTTRDYTDVGAVTAGAKRTFTGEDIDVEAADFVSWCGDNKIEYANTGNSGVWHGDYGVTPFTNEVFNSMLAGDAFSVYATGETAAQPQSITLTAIAEVSSVQAPSVAGSGAAPITLTAIAAPSAVQAPSLSGSGAAPITLSAVAAASSVQAPVVSHTNQYVVPGAVAVTSSVQAPSVAGSGAVSIAPSPVAVTASVQSPSVAGSGAAPITLSPVQVGLVRYSLHRLVVVAQLQSALVLWP